MIKQVENITNFVFIMPHPHNDCEVLTFEYSFSNLIGSPMNRYQLRKEMKIRP